MSWQLANIGTKKISTSPWNPMKWLLTICHFMITTSRRLCVTSHQCLGAEKVGWFDIWKDTIDFDHSDYVHAEKAIESLTRHSQATVFSEVKEKLLVQERPLHGGYFDPNEPEGSRYVQYCAAARPGTTRAAVGGGEEAAAGLDSSNDLTPVSLLDGSEKRREKKERGVESSDEGSDEEESSEDGGWVAVPVRKSLRVSGGGNSTSHSGAWQDALPTPLIFPSYTHHSFSYPTHTTHFPIPHTDTRPPAHKYHKKKTPPQNTNNQNIVQCFSRPQAISRPSARAGMNWMVPLWTSWVPGAPSRTSLPTPSPAWAAPSRRWPWWRLRSTYSTTRRACPYTSTHKV